MHAFNLTGWALADSHTVKYSFPFLIRLGTFGWFVPDNFGYEMCFNTRMPLPLFTTIVILAKPFQQFLIGATYPSSAPLVSPAARQQ